MAPPTEANILNSFLLAPAPLPNIITLEQFTELFPRAHQNNPRIPILYRELQHQRALDIDDVRTHIAAELKRGKQQRREVARARRDLDKLDLQAAGLGEDEINMEAELFAPSTHHPKAAPHTPDTLLPAVDRATKDLEAEIAAMEAESAGLLEEIRRLVGDLSDLRYGKFAQAGRGEDVLETLKALEAVAAHARQGKE